MVRTLCPISVSLPMKPYDLSQILASVKGQEISHYFLSAVLQGASRKK